MSELLVVVVGCWLLVVGWNDNTKQQTPNTKHQTPNNAPPNSAPPNS